MVDQSVFAASSIAQDTLEYNAAVEAATAEGEWPPASAVAYRDTLPEVLKGLYGGELYEAPSARYVSIEVDGRPIRARVIEPEVSSGIYFNMHGGGWTIGEPHYFDQPLERLSRAAGLTIVSVDYRKAPEDPYPAALDDCELVARWLVAGGSREFGGGPIIIGGDSSGANLALATLLRLRGTDSFDAIVGANLLYGVYDARLTPSVSGANRSVGPVTTEIMQWFVEQYVPPGVPPENAEISPLFANLSGLPPVLLTVGTKDVLLDDSLFMHARMLAAGVDAQIQVLPGGVHGFDLAPIAIASQAMERVVSFMTSLTAT